MDIRITYWKFPFWRAEVSRLALHLSGVPFTNVYPNRDSWARMKAEQALPYDQLPILEVDGTVIAQTGAIARFCGKLAGMYPDNPLPAAQVDELIDTCSDITGCLSATMRIRDTEERLEARRQLADTDLAQWLSRLNRRVQGFGDGPWLVGTRMTIADLAVWRLCDWLSSGILDGIPQDILWPHERLAQHRDHVGSIPQIRSYMAAVYSD